MKSSELTALMHAVLDGEAVCSPALARPPGQGLLDDLVGERVAVVGHEPWVGELLTWLITGAQPDGSGLAFKRGGVAWLEGQPKPGRMTLRAFLPPKVLRALAGAAAQ